MPVANLLPIFDGHNDVLLALYERDRGEGVTFFDHSEKGHLDLPRARELSQIGCATPDHVIRTKRLPMIGRDLAAFRQAYVRYFEEHAPTAAAKLTMLDPAPRVILDPELGLDDFVHVCTSSSTARPAIFLSTCCT